jgi:predicted short-subunit dehydrogenase-like oxidoreductase (DUF2520 family)
MRLGIVGGGRAAWAYGSAWLRIGWPITGVWLRPESNSRLLELLGAERRSMESLAADSELVLVAVSDSAIPQVAAKVPASEAIIFHASGSLRSLRDGFSLHPLKSLPPVGEESDLRDTLLVFEGQHRKTARLLATAIGGRFAEVTADLKPLYHAGAVFGSNYIAALLDVAEATLTRAGITDARKDLVALADSAMNNWQRQTGPGRFTGPASRGDFETMKAHLRALGDDPQVADIYKLLADWITGGNVATRK